MTKTAKRRLTVLTPIVILAIGYCAFTLVTTAVRLYQLHHEEKELKEELNNLKGTSKDLKTEITKLQDKDYVARYARENYLYTKDGEYVIKVPKDKKEKSSDQFHINEEYIIYGGVVLGSLIIFYIIAKHRKKKKEKLKNPKVKGKKSTK